MVLSAARQSTSGRYRGLYAACRRRFGLSARTIPPIMQRYRSVLPVEYGAGPDGLTEERTRKECALLSINLSINPIQSYQRRWNRRLQDGKTDEPAPKPHSKIFLSPAFQNGLSALPQVS